MGVGDKGTLGVRALQGRAGERRLKIRPLTVSLGQSLETVISSESRSDSECARKRH